MIELPVDRAIYAVDRESRTYRYARRNPHWDRLDPAVNEENKGSLDGYTRLFRGNRTRVFTYRPSQIGREHPAPARPPVAAGLPVAVLRRAVRVFVDEVDGLPDAPAPGAAWGPREVLAHLAFWHEHHVRILAALLDGRPPPRLRGTFTELNAQAVARYGGRSNRELVRRLLAAEARLERLARRTGATDLVIVLKEGATAWPIAAFLTRVAGHLLGHRAQLRRARAGRPAAARPAARAGSDR